MTDWFSTAVEMQREILRAQKTQIDAVQKVHKDATDQMLETGRQMQAMTDAGQKAVEANLQAWKAWAKFWGWS